MAAVPAVIGRDRDGELPVREPTVSRRHACIRATPEGLTLEDAGSRTGTRLGGFTLGATVPLRGSGTFEVGGNCRLTFTTVQQNRVELHGETGLDRGLWALVGEDPVDISPMLALDTPLFVEFSTGFARLLRPGSLAVSVAGKLIGLACDLLHGDVVEVAGGPAWEVV